MHQPTPHFAVLLLALIFLTPLIGCSAIVTDTQATATYTAQADWGTATVTLYSDHSFKQTVTPKNGPPKDTHGVWKLMRSSGSPVYTTVEFMPFLNTTHDKQGVYTVASVFSIYHVPFAGINIAADPEYGIAYRK